MSIRSVVFMSEPIPPWNDEEDRCPGCGAGGGEACEDWCGKDDAPPEVNDAAA